MPKEELCEEQKDMILKKCTILSCRKWVEVEAHEENVRCRGESCRSATYVAIAIKPFAHANPTMTIAAKNSKSVRAKTTNFMIGLLHETRRLPI